PGVPGALAMARATIPVAVAGNVPPFFCPALGGRCVAAPVNRGIAQIIGDTMANRKSKRNTQRHGPSTGAARQPDAKPTGARPPAPAASRPSGPGGGRLSTRRAAPPPRRQGLFGNQRFLVGYIIFAVLVFAGVTVYTNFINPPKN